MVSFKHDLIAVPKKIVWAYRTPPEDLLWRLQRLAGFFPHYGQDREAVRSIQKSRSNVSMKLRGKNSTTKPSHGTLAGFQQSPTFSRFQIHTPLSINYSFSADDTARGSWVGEKGAAWNFFGPVYNVMVILLKIYLNAGLSL